MAAKVNGDEGPYSSTPLIDSTLYKDKQKKPVPIPLAEHFTGERVFNDEVAASAANGIGENIFIPDWNNKPSERPAVVTFGGVPGLTHQNTSSIIAQPGLGKSSLCEATCASYLNPQEDCLGIEVSADCRGIIYIDNERTATDVWNSFYRMTKRAKVPYGSSIGNVKIAGLRSVPRLEERLKVIEYLVANYPCGLLLIDGAGDLVTDSNDLLQAIDCRIWLREMTVKYDLSILTTLHPNPNTNKPRGHIGSEVHRESECVLLVKSMGDDVRIVTSDFEHGKNRNNAHIATAYRWSDEHGMFVSTDADGAGCFGQQPRKEVARNKAELLALKVLPAPTALSYTDLCAAIEATAECSEATAKRKIKDMLEFDFVKKHSDGNYRLAV